MKLFSFFFFSSRRRHTRYWRDWSSDVCSSDLPPARAAARRRARVAPAPRAALAPRPGDARGGDRRGPRAAGERAHRGRDAAQHGAQREPLSDARRPARGPGRGRDRRLHARGRDPRGAAGPRPEAVVTRGRRLAVALLALPLLARAEERKTLEECIEIALRQQPTLRAAAATVAAGRERVWETAAAYLPQVSASYLASRRHASSSSLIGS